MSKAQAHAHKLHPDSPVVKHYNQVHLDQSTELAMELMSFLDNKEIANFTGLSEDHISKLRHVKH